MEKMGLSLDSRPPRFKRRRKVLRYEGGREWEEG